MTGRPDSIEHRTSSPIPWDPAIALVVGSLSLATYLVTLAPGLTYASPDGNELATVPYLLGLAHATGYPLYTWLGYLFTRIPVGEVAFRMNLMSAVLGAVGVGFLYAALREMGLGRLLAALSALVFAFSRTFWSQTSIAEVYAPNIFMLSLTLWLLLCWGRQVLARTASDRHATAILAAFALAFSLSLGTHLSNLGFAPAFALFLALTFYQVRRWPTAAEMFVPAAVFALGLLQFLWLPYKAQTVNDPLMLRNAPTTLMGIYRYTLGAFPEFKFAFPITALPGRLVLYLGLLRQNFGWLGMAAGTLGMAALLWRRPRHYFLLLVMYGVHVLFFIQYNARDLDVFFIPSHFLWTIFIAFGVQALADLGGRSLGHLTARLGLATRVAQRACHLPLAAFLALGLLSQLTTNWQINDRSQDTAVEDFYRNAFDLLPPDAVLFGRRGVFGYDAFYYRLVYQVRPDVLMPALGTKPPSPASLAGRPLYSTTPLQQGPRRSPWSVPPGWLPPWSELWITPVLFGSPGGNGLLQPQMGLTLYCLTDAAPELIVPALKGQGTPLEVGPLNLVASELDTSQAYPGGRLHLTLYWHLREKAIPRIALRLDGQVLEVHPLGLGNLPQYVQQYGLPDAGHVVREDYWVVIPSTAEPGNHTLSISAAVAGTPDGEGTVLAELDLPAVPTSVALWPEAKTTIR